jgi:hypothetical protein
VLAAADLAPFDSWAATFGRTVTALELAPDGASYRMQTRFARFQNVPELVTLYRQVADVRTTDDLNLPIPALAGGGPDTVVVPATGRLSTYVAELAARAERVRNRAVEPTEDNMLKITGDGRRAALDLRLVGEEPDPDGGKLGAAADRISAIHRETRSNRYLDPLGGPDARAGALQLVFCDASTPSGRGWNAYDELRSLLVERGVPRDGIRFVHEATSDEAKDKLFAACRDGRVAVLIGSTDKMGVGTNVQAHAIALHHLDCPWRPADIEQRDGRILRQGNQNPAVTVIRYATEGSFDIYMWQTVERKATFINQVATGRATDRDVDDIGDQALSYAEVKALATGNPLILEKAAVDAETSKLMRLERAHRDDQHRLRRALDAAEDRAATAKRRVEQLESAIERRTDTRGDRFSMTIDGARHTKRADAGTHVLRLASDFLADVPPGATARRDVGEMAGLAVAIEVDRRIGQEVVLLAPDADVDLRLPASELAHDPLSAISRLERRIHGLDGKLESTREALREAVREKEHAQERIGTPFEHATRLDEFRCRQRVIQELLTSQDEAATAAARARGSLDELVRSTMRVTHASPSR